MKNKTIKIDALRTDAPCPCGKAIVSNYDKYIEHDNYCNVINRCPECSEKYFVRYDPTSKKMHFITNDGKAVFTFVNKLEYTKISKAHYSTEYKFDLKELDELDKISKPAVKLEMPKLGEWVF